MAQQVDIIDTWRQEDGSLALTFMPPDEDVTAPAAHVIPTEAYADRAVRHGYDPDDPEFHEKVTRHILHEARTPAPDHVRASPGYRLGVVHDLAAADAVISWRFRPEHVETIRGAVARELIPRGTGPRN